MFNALVVIGGSLLGCGGGQVGHQWLIRTTNTPGLRPGAALVSREIPSLSSDALRTDRDRDARGRLRVALRAGVEPNDAVRGHEPRALREGYLEQLKLFTEQMKKMCRGMHIDFERMNSSEPLDVALSGFLATRAASIK